MHKYSIELLRYLYQRNAGYKAAMIRDGIKIPKQHLSSIINYAISNEWVESYPCILTGWHRDSRKHWIKITDKGRRELAEIYPDHVITYY